MTRITTDLFISGGGPAGLSAAAAFGAAGFSVVLAEPTAPVTQADAPGADLRTTAILQPGRRLLEEAGVWDHLDATARPLDRMRIVDAARTPVSRDFVAADISDRAFGWNMTNTALRAGLLARLAELPNVSLRTGVGFRAMVARETGAVVTLTDGSQITARLVLACDGRNSPVRQANGISMRRTGYGQKAVVFAATHPVPHDHVSTEVHKSGGPFTLVPLPDQNGQPCSGIVWMNDGPEITRLAALSDAAFEAEATARSAGLFGALTLVSKRQVWPIISQISERFDAPRTALAAEAAHVVPPIGAQGLNMSLGDIAELLRLATARPEGLGDAQMLRAYHRRRWPEVKARLTGVDLLNRASQSDMPGLQRARAAGIRALHDITPIRRAMMRLGLGA